MKKLIKKKNNKGFSLVELIVVIAIMAVLVGILAPSLLRYVEKSRIQKDESAVAEVENAIKIALAEEAINDSVSYGSNATFAISNSTSYSTGAGITTTSLKNEVENTCGTTVKFSSKKYKSATYTITIAAANNITGVWSGVAE